MTDTLERINAYFSERIRRHGAVPAGVDWNGDEAQIRRFDVLCRMIRLEGGFSVNDLGCGYGKMAEYLADRYPGCRYYGYDISEDMVRAALEQHEGRDHVSFVRIDSPSEMRVSDYTVASGVFNVRLDRSDEAWTEVILHTLDEMNKRSRLGFAFNMLTSYSDQEYMKSYLYYGDPCYFFDFCKKNYSRNVALLHDYDLYDFTIHVHRS